MLIDSTSSSYFCLEPSGHGHLILERLGQGRSYLGGTGLHFGLKLRKHATKFAKLLRSIDPQSDCSGVIGLLETDYG